MRRSTLLALLSAAVLFPGTAFAQEDIARADVEMDQGRPNRDAREARRWEGQDRPQPQANPGRFEGARPDLRVNSPDVPRVSVAPPERVERAPRFDAPAPSFNQPRPQPQFTPPVTAAAPLGRDFDQSRGAGFQRDGRSGDQRFGQPGGGFRRDQPDNQPVVPPVRTDGSRNDGFRNDGFRNDGFRTQPGFRTDRPDVRQDRRDDFRNAPNRQFDTQRPVNPRPAFPGNNGLGNDGFGNRGIDNRARTNPGWGNRDWGSRGWGNQGWGNQGWQNQGWRNQGWGNGGNNNRWDQNRGNNWNRDWRRDNRWDWRGYRNYNRDVFRLPRYYAPYGWQYGYRRFTPGVTLNTLLFNQNYWLQDPEYFHLPAPQWPYVWVRYYNDALLIDAQSGYVVDVVNDIFWDY